MNGVNKTLYIPLYGKSYVSKKGIILDDKKAEQIWEAEGFPLKGKSKSKWLAYYMGTRSAVFDEWLSQQMVNAQLSHLQTQIKYLSANYDTAFALNMPIEEFYKTFENNNEVPDSKKMDIFRYNLNMHIKYMENLLISRKWLACERFTIADVAAATHISILDYIGHINWRKYPKLVKPNL